MGVNTRPMRRIAARGGHLPGGKAAGRAASRKTGQPEWFRRMKWDVEQRIILSKLPVHQLAVHGVCTIKQAAALDAAGLKTVWDVTSASYTDMLRVDGFGPKTIAKLWQDAKIKGNLTMKWVPPSGR